MALIILLFVLFLPLTELYVLIEVGEEIGGFETIILCLLTAALGLQLIKAQGLGLAKRIQSKIQSREAIGQDMAEGVLLAVSGLCLLIPGFVTDILGFFLLIPPMRKTVVLLIAKTLANRAGSQSKGSYSSIIIEGQSWPMHKNNDYGGNNPNTHGVIEGQVIPPSDKNGPYDGPEK